MVYFQVEDVLRKFEALSELESNDWKQQTTKKLKTRRGKVQRSVQNEPSLSLRCNGWGGGVKVSTKWRKYIT